MTGEKRQRVSSYGQYLPAYLQNDLILGKFLLAFEQILSGGESNLENSPPIIEPATDEPPGYEEILEQIDTYFIPKGEQQTPEEFLPWLASWVALSLREDWGEQAKRAFLAQVVPLYQLRGTKVGLRQILGIYMKNNGFPDDVTIRDDFPESPNYFQVELTLSTADLEGYTRQQQIAMAIINQEKPTHTYYSLRIGMPTMRITTEDSEHILTIGKLTADGEFGDGNTIIGTIFGK
ncbi:MAG: phage tail protein I [Symploca sp. SIO1B1]|nr:phage tail protein I [Symploca sp. SIO1B1]